MYRRTPVVGVAVLIAGLAACASHSTNQAGAGELAGGNVSWSGSIKPAERNTGTIGSTRKSMVEGSVFMTRDTKDPTRSRIDLVLSSPTGNSSVSWALVPGRCRSGGVPVLPVNNFQPIDVGSSGRAELSVSIPFEFPDQGSYHVDIYAGNRATLADVVACSDLKLKD